MSAMIWAIRELFDETGHPRNLTVFNTSGQGARGKVPGSIEDLGAEGLLHPARHRARGNLSRRCSDWPPPGRWRSNACRKAR